MRVSIISQSGCSLGFAHHLNQEGHTVTTATNSTISYLPDMAITDYLDTELTEDLRKKGVKVLGCSSWSKLLESNEDYRRATIRALGYSQPNEITGDKVTVACWFNGNKIISKMLVFPYTRLMSADVGVNVECSGYLAYFNVAQSKLVSTILDPLDKYLRKAAHKGCFSVDCRVNKNDITVESISGNIDKAYMTALFENSRMSKSDILLKILDESSNAIPSVEPWVCGVLISVAPYPFYHPMELSKIEGFNPFNLKHLWLIDAEREGDVWVCGRKNGMLGYVTARGSSIQEVTRRAYRTIANIHVETIQYRNDIGKDVYQRFDNLKTNGHLG